MTQPVRILNVVGRMDRGGVETWLMNVLRFVDRSRFAIDFLVHSTKPGAYDDEIHEAGGAVLLLPHPTPGFSYRRRLKALLANRRYDVVHSHVHHFSGVVLRAAEHLGIAVRLAHSHSDTRIAAAEASMFRRVYLTTSRHLIRRHATMGLAASAEAAAALFGWSPTGRHPWRILHYGIDLEPFRRLGTDDALRQEFGFAREDVVVGHVGNLHDAKNHSFTLRVFADFARRESNSRLLLVGEGPLADQLKREAQALGIDRRVVFAGSRADVPSLLTSVIDIFLFPSRWEGLPVAVIEAQAAGLPILLSDRISEEAIAIPPLVQRLSIEAEPSVWSAAIQRCVGVRYRDAGLRAVADSDFNIERGLASLQTIYAGATSCLPPIDRA